MGIQDYIDSEFKHALARNIRSLTRGKKPSKHPIAILLGGQSGAGKTTIHRIKQKEFQGNIVINYSMLLLLDNTIITFKNKKTGSKLIESIILKLEFS